jgi:hypothetical protein
LGLFGNAHQSIPVRFIEKIRVDAEISNLLAPRVIAFSDIPAMKEKLKPLREEQQALRTSCINFIKEQKARGPNSTD